MFERSMRTGPRLNEGSRKKGLVNSKPERRPGGLLHPCFEPRAPFLSPFLIPPYSRRLRCLEVGNHCLSDPSADIPLVLVASYPLAFFSPFFLRLLSSFRISRSREIRRLRLLNFIVPLFVALPRSSSSPSSLVNSQPLALYSLFSLAPDVAEARQVKYHPEP